mmetsp:Transcript_57347/g.148000  ORF Transcript_57347/g.148000 Transcript_57347/m.148000 type:complete len:83 (-) Transcript_57347:437-685(-)
MGPQPRPMLQQGGRRRRSHCEVGAPRGRDAAVPYVSDSRKCRLEMPMVRVMMARHQGRYLAADCPEAAVVVAAAVLKTFSVL